MNTFMKPDIEFLCPTRDVIFCIYINQGFLTLKPRFGTKKYNELYIIKIKDGILYIRDWSDSACDKEGFVRVDEFVQARFEQHLLQQAEQYIETHILKSN